MKRLLDFRSRDRPEPEDGTRIVDADEEGAVLDALGSETTRDVLAAVYEEAGTASELAERVDASLQNTTYHLDKLRDADLVRVADTWYSEQGTEMKVYAPTNESVVVLAGDDDARSSLRDALSGLLGALGVLVAGSVVVEGIVRAPWSPYQSADPVFNSAPAVGGVSPGVLFFSGGLFALALVALWSSRSSS